MNKNTEKQVFSRDEVSISLHQEAAELLYREDLQPDEELLNGRKKTLERRLEILKIYDATQPPSRKKRGLIIILFGMALLIVTSLYAVRIPHTDIELDLALTDLSFTITEQWPVIEKLLPSAIRLSPLREIQIPRSSENAEKTLSGQELTLNLSQGQSETAAGHIKLRDTEGRDIIIESLVHQQKKSTGVLTLTHLEVPKNTKIWLAKTDIDNQYRLSLEIPEGEEFVLNIGVIGKIRINLPGSEEERNFPAPRAFTVKSASNAINIDLTLPNGDRVFLPSQLHAKALSFNRIDQIITTQGTVVREVSTIQSGVLYFTAFRNRDYVLKTGEGVHLEENKGIIRKLSLENNMIAMEFHGQIGGITAGRDNQKHTKLMPTCLEWITRPILTAYWGAIVSLFTVGLGVYRWWKAST